MDPKKHICIIARKRLTYNSRVTRQVETYLDEGHRVSVISLGSRVAPGNPLVTEHTVSPFKPDVGFSPSLAGFFSLLARSCLLIDSLERRFLHCSSLLNVGFELTFIANVLDIALRDRADVYVVHDSYPLIVCSLIARRHRAKVIYDSVELAFDRGRRVQLVGRWRPWLERPIVRRVHSIVTIGDSLAKAISDYYRVKLPTVVRNCSKYQQRPEVRRESNTVVYVGGISPAYGVEDLVNAMALVERSRLRIVGPSSDDDRRRLMRLIERLGLESRIDVLQPVEPKQVLEVAATGEVGMIYFRTDCLNRQLACPNKLFEYIMARVPIVSVSTPDIREIVEGCNIGLVVEDADPKALAVAIGRVIRDKETYQGNLDACAREYCWENEARKLVALLDE
jgi:glycosyltransferase involved in cell wall biosynthesis